jgi:hypothetical protein
MPMPMPMPMPMAKQDALVAISAMPEDARMEDIRSRLTVIEQPAARRVGDAPTTARTTTARTHRLPNLRRLA